MKYIIPLLLFFTACCRNASAQAKHNWLDTFDLCPHFQKGDVRTYDVYDMDKAEMMFLGSRAEVRYRVQFLVADTLRNGWLMQYSVHTLSAKDHNFSTSSLIGTLSDGLDLTFYLGRYGDWQLDSTQYAKEKDRLANAYDSALATLDIDTRVKFSVRQPLIRLREPDGLQSFIGPLISFTNMYQKGIFKKYKREEAGYTSDLFGRHLVDGVLSNEWKSTSEKSGTVTLNTFFTADEISAAKYYSPMIRQALEAEGRHIGRFTIPKQIRNTLEHIYTVEQSSRFPVYIFEKSVIEWDLRTVSKLEMRQTDH